MNRLLAMALLVLLVVPAEARLAEEEETFRDVLLHHLARYPEMEIQDVYKLVFQAAMGAEHAVSDLDAARAWLERELEDLTPGVGEPLMEPLSADGRLIRVNLRTYRERGGDMEKLLEAFVETGTEFLGSKDRLRRHWTCLELMAAEEDLRYTATELRDFFRKMEGQGLPAVHHSARYRSLYDPAYRVVLRALFD